MNQTLTQRHRFMKGKVTMMKLRDYTVGKIIYSLLIEANGQNSLRRADGELIKNVLVYKVNKRFL